VLIILFWTSFSCKVHCADNNRKYLLFGGDETAVKTLSCIRGFAIIGFFFVLRAKKMCYAAWKEKMKGEKEGSSDSTNHLQAAKATPGGYVQKLC